MALSERASCCSASIPNPIELAVRSAEANLSVALQAADVSVADIAAARAQITKQRADLSASRQLNRSSPALSTSMLLPKPRAFDQSPTQQVRRPDLTRAEADLRKAKPILASLAFAIQRFARLSPRSIRHGSTCATPRFARPPMARSPICGWRPANMWPLASPC